MLVLDHDGDEVAVGSVGLSGVHDDAVLVGFRSDLELDVLLPRQLLVRGVTAVSERENSVVVVLDVLTAVAGSVEWAETFDSGVGFAASANSANAQRALEAFDLAVLAGESILADAGVAVLGLGLQAHAVVLTRLVGAWLARCRSLDVDRFLVQLNVAFVQHQSADATDESFLHFSR